MPKACLKCGEMKVASGFSRDRTRRDGRHPYCKGCCRALPRSEKQRKAAKERAGAWYRDNPERVASYYARAEVKARRRDYMRAWRAANKTAVREYAKGYERRRGSEDLSYRLAVALRKRLGVAIRGGQKRGSAVDDLGCTIDELRAHLEARFLPGMSWENWGRAGWHIDHIQPLASFDLTDEEQFKRAVHHSNLQPLWAVDNLKKGRYS
jgi:hypothetical protein